jgi:hypothetical protein
MNKPVKKYQHRHVVPSGYALAVNRLLLRAIVRSIILTRSIRLKSLKRLKTCCKTRKTHLNASKTLLMHARVQDAVLRQQRPR